MKPKSKAELINLITKTLKVQGIDADLNFIDTSLIKDMSYLFYHFSLFNGDISNWDVSNVKDMEGMFWDSDFNGDISNWNVSGVEDMYGMFSDSKFNGDISKWNVSNVEDMRWMFSGTDFDGDIEDWDVDLKKCDFDKMFDTRNLPNAPNWYIENIGDY